jgi:hypothetical protein
MSLLWPALTLFSTFLAQLLAAHNFQTTVDPPAHSGHTHSAPLPHKLMYISTKYRLFEAERARAREKDRDSVRILDITFFSLFSQFFTTNLHKKM